MKKTLIPPLVGFLLIGILPVINWTPQSLQWAPNSEHARFVNLASAAVPVEQSDTVLAAFGRGDYQALEDQFGAILRERKKRSDGHSFLSKAYDELTYDPDVRYSMEQRLVRLEDWLRSNPSSHFANAMIGSFYVTYAWDARGGGFGDTVSETNYRLFKERLLKARSYLENAYLADPSDPIVPSALVKVSMGLGDDFAEMEKQFQRAIQADVLEYCPYKAKLTYLMPKWHGSQELMLSFARKTARDAPSNSLAPLILAQAHWEIYERSADKKMYFRQPEVWDEVKSVYSLICKRFSGVKERHNWFARAAYLAGDFETAREQMAFVEKDWSQRVWGNFADFSRAKAEILGK